MERLMNIVEAQRRILKLNLEKMADDYIDKACKALKEHLEKYKLDSYYIVRFAVEIVDIDFEEGTVEIGDVWAEYRYEDVILGDEILELEDIEDFHIYVLKSQAYEAYDVNLFIEELMNYGFENFAYDKNFSTLLPIIVL